MPQPHLHGARRVVVAGVRAVLDERERAVRQAVGLGRHLGVRVPVQLAPLVRADGLAGLLQLVQLVMEEMERREEEERGEEGGERRRGGRREEEGGEERREEEDGGGERRKSEEEEERCRFRFGRGEVRCGGGRDVM